jgi:hypothetical protein
MFQGNESVVLISRSAGTVDEFGIPVVTETETTIDGCLLGYGETSEPVKVGDFPGLEAAMLFLPNGTSVGDADEFEVRGERWVKDGIAQSWSSPFNGNIRPKVVQRIRRRVA